MCAEVKTFSIGKFDLNPRGNLWVKDADKIGQKLLVRMGWREGKGLGRGENGITDCIKVRMKVGNAGVGFNEKLPLGIENDAYNAVLESLNKKFKTNGESVKVQNGLEQRSQQFKNRLHYRKFVRGKDVGRYSEKDMNSIFVTGKAEPTASVPLKSNVMNVDSALHENPSPELLPTFKSQLSMKDYFAMKMKKKSGEVPPSDACNTDSQNTNDTPPLQKSTSSKKRKRERKNGAKAAKRLKSQQPSGEEGEDDTLGLPAEENTSTEVKEKGKWAGKLKSCLKKLPFGLWFQKEAKEVSFNDSVSYKIIENALDKDNEDILDNQVFAEYPLSADFDEDSVLEEGEYVDDVFVDDMQSTTEEDTAEGDGCYLEETSDNSNHTDNSTEYDVPKCLDLPKCDNSNYNAWLESQRIATKMKLYKNMMKKIRKNPVLRTSSILDLKGYGNWGF